MTMLLYKGGKYQLSIKRILKKEGIEIVRELDTLAVNT